VHAKGVACMRANHVDCVAYSGKGALSLGYTFNEVGHVCCSQAEAGWDIANHACGVGFMLLASLFCSVHPYKFKFSLDYKGIQPGMAAQPMRTR
jgi:hypothetical protein